MKHPLDAWERAVRDCPHLETDPPPSGRDVAIGLGVLGALLASTALSLYGIWWLVWMVWP